ncbi:soluble inorganic pyrophosphatase 6, chloroplastic-like protein [Cinnamomum micranthum f. kanehirae]|uniref:Soluble inorganic pyrophosphatase 6, chloroplastic-like protein n=1 Tax=Cinnamomum micranthum f. kanehirae TaxID=337451 RepID=A0A443N686_9MAGN|nr:soluble inorganic pyrophosphatase 6, chloroplastic-like protein [Cinnamomum micranthum f. kanehirae]
MAATRVLAAALHSNLNLNLKQPFYFKQKALSLATKPPRRRFLFTCTALHNPSNVQTKEEGQPQTLDYRVFFMDTAGKKETDCRPPFGW